MTKAPQPTRAQAQAATPLSFTDGSGFRYAANSLEDIAIMFKSQAESDRNRADFAKTEKEKRIHHASASAWEAAANILRRTTINGAE